MKLLNVIDNITIKRDSLAMKKSLFIYATPKVSESFLGPTYTPASGGCR